MNTDNKGEKCHWCSKRFQRGGALTNHVNKYHPSQVKLLTDSSRLYRSTITVNRYRGDPIYDAPTSAEDADADFEILQLFDATLPENVTEHGIGSESARTEHTRADENDPRAHEKNLRADSSPVNTESTKYYGRPIREAPYVEENSLGWNPLEPFISPTDYKMARYFVESKSPLTRIDEYFYSIMPPQLIGTSFGSAHTMRNKLRLMEQKYRIPIWERGVVTYTIAGQQEFFHRNILECIQYLLRQKSFSQHWAWSSKKEYDFEGVRQYHEMYTGDWWARIEVS